jgi:hypothetical protein
MKKNIIQKISAAGILFEETQEIYERMVLSVSQESSKKYGIQKYNFVMVQNSDTFDIRVADKILTAIDDRDIMCNFHLASKLHAV